MKELQDVIPLMGGGGGGVGVKAIHCRTHESPKSSRGRTESGNWLTLGGFVLISVRIRPQSSGLLAFGA